MVLVSLGVGEGLEASIRGWRSCVAGGKPVNGGTMELTGMSSDGGRSLESSAMDGTVTRVSGDSDGRAAVVWLSTPGGERGGKEPTTGSVSEEER